MDRNKNRLPSGEITRQYDKIQDLLDDMSNRPDDQGDLSTEIDAELIEEITNATERAGTDTNLAVTTPEKKAPPPTPDKALIHWQDLAQRLKWETSATTSPSRTAALFYQLGHIFENYLGQPDLALEAYRASHQRHPGLGVNSRALSRLLARTGDFESSASVMQAELGAASSDGQRVAILIERGLLRLSKLSDIKGARSDLLAAQKLAPQDPAVIDALMRLYSQSGELAPMEPLLRQRIRGCKDTALCSALHCQLARIKEKMGDTEGAAAAYRSALEMTPDNRHPLYALLRIARANNDHPTAAELCERVAKMESGEAAAAALWTAACIYRDRIRDPDLAIDALERARDVSPNDRGLLMELADLYEENRRWEQLAGILEQMASLSDDPAESADFLCRLAQIKLERLQDQESAIDGLRRAIDLVPESITVGRMLGRLLAKLDRHDEIPALLQKEREHYSDPSRRAAIAFRIGHLYETKLEDPERAAASYEEALADQPDFRPAIRAVSRIYNSQGRFEDLVASYERELAITSNREDRLLLLRRIADTWERKIGDPAAALSSYERLVAIEPSNLPTLHALVRLYAMGSRWADLANVLRSDAEQTMDRWRRVTLLTQCAEVQQLRMNDDEAALQTYMEVLDLAPGHQPALMAAGKILHQAERHEELVKLHQRELDSTEDRFHRGWLLMKVGRILWEKLGRLDEAAAIYSEAAHMLSHGEEKEGNGDLASSPAVAAMDQLIRIFRMTGNHPGLLQAMQKMPLPDSGPVRSLHHRRVAEVLQHGQRPALAVDHLRRALDASDDDAALFQLAQIYASIGDRQSLISLYQREAAQLDDSRGTMAVQYKLARLYGEAEYDLDRAVEALQTILEIEPRNRSALLQLEKQLARLGRWRELAAVLELDRESSDDTDYRVACALEIAALKADRLGDLQGAAHSSFEVLNRYPSHPEALATLEHYYRRSSNPSGLIQVLGRRLKAAQSSTEQSAILTSIGAIHANCGELAEAQKMFRLATEAMPHHLPALQGWHRAALAEGDAGSSAEALELQGASSKDTFRKARCYLEAGQTWQHRVKDLDRAVAAYSRVLELLPLHRDAMEALSSIYTSREDWPALVSLLQRSVAHLDSADQARATLVRIADIQRSRLGDVLAARESILQAIEIHPDDQGLLTTMAELCRAAEDFSALAHVNQRLIKLTSDPVLLKALYFELGMIWEEKLPDTAQAISQFKRVLELDPNDLGSLTRLSALLVREKDWDEAAKTTEYLLHRDNNRNRVREYHLRLAKIYSEGFDDLERAVESCRRALSLDPGDLYASDMMAHLLSSAGDKRSLDAHLASTIAVHRARLDRDPFQMDSYRALLKVFHWQRADDPLLVIRSILCVIGAASKEDRRHVAQRRRSADAFTARPLTSEEIEELLVVPPERGPLYRVLVQAESTLRKILPSAERSTTGTIKITARSHPELSALIERLSQAVGGVDLSACLVDGGSEQLRVEDTSPPTLIIGREMQETLSDHQTTFRLARMVAHVRLRHMLYTRIKPVELGRATAAILSTILTSFESPYPDQDLQTILSKLNRVMGKRLRRQLESPCVELLDRHIEPERWREAMEQSEDRVALAISGDLQAALECLLRDEAVNIRPQQLKPEKVARVAGTRMRKLLSFAISEEYLTLRERAGSADLGM